MSGTKIGEFFMRCRHAATAAHVLHLKTDSYAQHVALGEFYTSVIERADAVAETYIGRYGRFECPALEYVYPADAPTLLRALRGWIDKHREEVCDCREAQNLIDEMLELIDSTMYKVRFLR